MEGDEEVALKVEQIELNHSLQFFTFEQFKTGLQLTKDQRPEIVSVKYHSISLQT